MGEVRISNHQLPSTSEQILEKTKIIESVCQSNELILHILKNYRHVAINIKDSREAVAFFILGTPDGFCYIFDVLICENMISHGGIKHLLECCDIVKVLIDSKFLYDVMRCFNVCPTNVFDAQIAYQLIEGLKRNCSPSVIERVALCCISNIYGRELRVPDESYYNQLERCYLYYLECRPISCDLAECFAREVLCLVPEAYLHMCLLIPSNKQNLLLYLTEKNVGLISSQLSNGSFTTQKSFAISELNPNEVEANGRSSPCISAFSNECTNCTNCQCKICQSVKTIKYRKRPLTMRHNSKFFGSPFKVFNLGPTPWAWGYSPIRDNQINYFPSCSPQSTGRKILSNSHKNERNNSNHHQNRRRREESNYDDRKNRKYGSEGSNSMEFDDSDNSSAPEESQQSDNSERSSHHRKHREHGEHREHRNHRKHREHRDGHSDRRSRSGSHHSSDEKQSKHRKAAQNESCLLM